MQIPTSKLSSERLVQLGLYHLAALDQTPQTQSLGQAFRPQVDAVRETQRKREEAEVALVAPRVALFFSEFSAEVALRRAAYDASQLDGKQGGPVFKAIFPNGLDPEVRPRGEAQLERLRGVRNRLDTQAAAAPLKAKHLPAIDAASSDLASKLEARKKAAEALALARAAEDGARESFVHAYDGNAGAIRQMFPRDSVRQNLYFDSYRSREVGEEESTGPTVEGIAEE